MPTAKEQLLSFIQSIFKKDEMRKPLAQPVDLTSQRSFGQNLALGPLGDFGVKLQEFGQNAYNTFRTPDRRISSFINDPTVKGNVESFARGNRKFFDSRGLTGGKKGLADLANLTVGTVAQTAVQTPRLFNGKPITKPTAPIRAGHLLGDIATVGFRPELRKTLSGIGLEGRKKFFSPKPAFETLGTVGAILSAGKPLAVAGVASFMGAIESLVSGVTDDPTDDKDFITAAGEALPKAASLAGFTSITGPGITKFGKYASNLFGKQSAIRDFLIKNGAQGIANVGEGIVLDKVLEYETDALSISIDFFMPATFNIAGSQLKGVIDKMESVYKGRVVPFLEALKTAKSTQNMGNQVSEIVNSKGITQYYNHNPANGKVGFISKADAIKIAQDFGPKEAKFIKLNDHQYVALNDDGVTYTIKDGLKETTHKATPEQLEQALLVSMGLDLTTDEEGNLELGVNKGRLLFAGAVSGGRSVDKDKLLKEGGAYIKNLLRTNKMYDDYLKVVNEGFVGSIGKVNLLKQGFDRFVRSGQGALNTMGRGGRVLVKQFKQAEFYRETRGGQAFQKYRQAIEALTSAEKESFYKVAQGMQEAVSPAEQSALNIWNIIRKDISDTAIGTNLKIEGKNWTPRKNFWPRSLPKDALGKDRDRFLRKMVESGEAQSLAEAEALITKFIREQPVQRYGHLERSRTGKLPVYETDPIRAIEPYIKGAYGRLGDAIHLGPNNELVKVALNVIESEGHDSQTAKVVTDAILGKIRHGEFMSKVADRATVIQVITKMGLSALTNITQVNMTALYTNPWDMMRAIGGFLTNKTGSKEWAERAGVISDDAIKQTSELLNLGKESDSWKYVAEAFLKVTAFTPVETMNRVTAAMAGKARAIRFAEKLLKDPTNDRYIRELKRLDLEAAKILQQGELVQDDLYRAGRKVVEETQFISDALRTPVGFQNPLGRILTQFKKFGYLATKMHAQNIAHVTKEAVRGNPGPLITTLFVLGVQAPIAGEIVLDIKSVLRNKQRTKKGRERFVENTLAAAGFGLVMDLGGLSGEFGPKGVTNVVAGPTAQDIHELVDAGLEFLDDRPSLEGVEDFKSRSRPLVKGAVKRVPIIGPALLNTFISNSNVPAFVGKNAQYLTDEDKYRADVVSSMTDLPNDPKDIVILYENALDVENRFHEARLKIQYDGSLTEDQRIKKIKALEDKTYEAIKMKNKIAHSDPDAAFVMQLNKMTKTSSVDRRVDWVRDVLSKTPEAERNKVLMFIMNYEYNGKKIITKKVAERLGLLGIYNSLKSSGSAKTKKVSIKSVPKTRRASSSASSIKVGDFTPAKIGSIADIQAKAPTIDLDLESLRNPELGI